ncbi:MAG: signal peptidase II [Jatrophihabitantaceae bacterium]
MTPPEEAELTPDGADNAESERGSAGTSVRGSRVRLFAVVALIALALDILTKVLIVSNTQGHQPKRILDGAIYLDVTRNSGAAFSLGTGFTVILTIIALAVVLVIIRTARRMRSLGWAICLGLILGGALGNLVDRIFRAPGIGRGHVVDFISAFGPDGVHWPIFNIADSCIVCGAILAAILALRGTELDGTSARG